MDPQTLTTSAGGQATAVRLQPEPRTLPYAQIAWYLLLLIAVFFPVLSTMVQEWAGNDDMGHAFFVPVIFGYIVWNEREKILAQPIKTCWPALGLVVWGFFQTVLGFLGADFFTSRIGFLIAVVGVIWTLAGTKVVRALAFPLGLLLFMVRIPLFAYQQMTFPLQIFASEVARFALDAIGIPVVRNGNILELPSQRLQVIEACSGIRSLLSLSFLSLVYAYMFDKRRWMRPVLFVITIPIAITANAFRVTLTGILSEYKKDWAEGFFHTFEGWIIFMVALICLGIVHRLICRFTRVADA
jgi:exosortase